MTAKSLSQLYHEIPQEAHGVILCYILAGILLYVVVLSPLPTLLKFVLVVYIQIVMVFLSFSHRRRNDSEHYATPPLVAMSVLPSMSSSKPT